MASNRSERGALFNNWHVTDRAEDSDGSLTDTDNLESEYSSTSTPRGVPEVTLTRSERRSLPSLQTQQMERSLGLIARKYEIKPSMAARLKALRNYEIVIVCDDSGSMSTGIEGPERTRWDRLRNIVQLVLEIGVIFDSNGVDIYFLNQDPILNVKDPAQVIDIFSNGPSGYTPLAATLQEVFQLSPSRRGHDKQLLVFIATDGAPTDENGNEEIAPLEHIMREVRRAETTFVSFLICTDDREKVGYLNLWDQTMVNVDVTDDFINERERVRRYRGDSYPFSMGDYVVKALIGAIDPQINAINEPSPNQL